MQVTNEWQQILATEFEQPYYKKLQQFLAEEYEKQTIYPSKQQVLNALQTTPYSQVKVVLLGQDPYHGAGQAHGLSFSVQPGVPHPPSLRNMFQELQDDLKVPVPTSGSLLKWAEQGVLLLNTVLTVRAGEANSHKGQGWEQFTDAIIKKLTERDEPVIFLLWGKPAQTKRKLIEQGVHHIILQAPHPSPLSAYRGFFGSKPYSRVNAALQTLGQDPIDWSLS